jgi:hypothetical protein
MNIPQAMVSKNQWVCWKYKETESGKTKVLINPKTSTYADSTNPDTWSDYQTALDKSKDFNGIGFVFYPQSSSIMGIDIDHIDNPERQELAKKIVSLFNSYTEISPSGNGYHIYIYGKKNFDWCKNTELGLEVYDKDRFFTVTGNNINYNQIENRQAELNIFGKQYSSNKETIEENSNGWKEIIIKQSPKTDQEVLSIAFSSKNGDKIYSLYNGELGSYQSGSEADMALYSHLFFFSQDPAQTKRIMMNSKLKRDKWKRDDLWDRMYSVVIKNKEFVEPTKKEPDKELLLDDFKIISFNDMPDSYNPEDWILEDMFCKGGLFTFSAYNKTGKTIFLTCMYKAMSDNLNTFVGKKLQKVKTLHISEEYEKQWSKKKQDFGYAYVDIAPNSLGYSNTIEEWEAKIKLISKACDKYGYEMVVFDTLDEFWPVDDENSAGAAKVLRSIKENLTIKNICVILVMHTGKTVRVVGKDLRGTSAFNDKADGIISFRRVQEENVMDNKRKLIVSNGRFYEEPYELILEFDNNKKEYNKVAENSYELEMKELSMTLLDYISADKEDPMSINAINKNMESDTGSKFRSDKMNKVLSYMIKNKMIMKKQHKNYIGYYKIINPFKEIK